MANLPVTGVVNLALDLVSALDVKASTTRCPDENLTELASRIGSTALLLRQLYSLLSEDLAYRGTTGEIVGALKEEGEKAIHNVSAQCEAVYRTVITNFIKSGRRGRKNKLKAIDIDSTKLKTDIIAYGYITGWLRPRLKLSLDQLSILRGKLLVMLQVMNLAKLQV